MTSRNTAAGSTYFRRVNNLPTYPSQPVDDWYRHPAWLPLPAVQPTEQKMVLLNAVFKDYGYNAASLMAFGANFTVDWGDGSATENFTAGTTASHVYDYDNTNLVGTEAPVTFTAATSTVDRTAHGFKDGQKMQFASISTANGLAANSSYFVVNATADTFQVASDLGGTPITITANATGNLLRYRQAVITVTKNSGGNFSAYSINVRPTYVGATGYSSGYLDVLFSSPYLTTCTVSSSSVNAYHRYLEQAQLISDNNVANNSYVFQNCTALRSVPVWKIRPLASGTVNMQNMFAACKVLVTAPRMETGACNNFMNMFQGCSALRYVPLYDMSSAGDVTAMFNACSALRVIPAFNLASVTNATQMFAGCTGLVSAPSFNLANATTLASMFSVCSSLEYVGKITAPKAINLAGMFTSCTSLRQSPEMSFGVATTFGSMFSNCTTLESVRALDMSKAVGTNSMFLSCSSLTEVHPSVVTLPATVTNATAMFQNCSSLRELPPITIPLSQSWLGMFNACYSLRAVTILGGGPTSLDSTFKDCWSLVDIDMPTVTSACTTFASAFNGCNSLLALPAMDMSGPTSATGFGSCFSACYNLGNVSAVSVAPKFNFTMPGPNNLSPAQVSEFFNKLPTVYPTAQTVTTTGAPWKTALVKTGTTTMGSKTITVTDATGLTVGMSTTSNQLALLANASVTVDSATDKFGFVGLNMENGTPVAFISFGSLTGISVYTVYYVVNATADDFQIALTPGGAAIDFSGTSTSAMMRYGATITAINGNTLTMSTPGWFTSVANGATINFRSYDVTLATLRNWTVT